MLLGLPLGFLLLGQLLLALGFLGGPPLLFLLGGDAGGLLGLLNADGFLLGGQEAGGFLLGREALLLGDAGLLLGLPLGFFLFALPIAALVVFLVAVAGGLVGGLLLWVRLLLRLRGWRRLLPLRLRLRRRGRWRRVGVALVLVQRRRGRVRVALVLVQRL